MKSKKISIKEFSKHKTKQNVLIRFLIITSILIIYLSFAIGHYGLSNGILVTFLSWSLFVFCTPVADAGFLLDFPIRLFTKIRMLYSELIVWGVALLLNIFALIFNQQVYEKTFLLHLLKVILINPFPYWSIIILSAAGTFLSIYFADELMDVVTHNERKNHKKHKKKYLWVIAIFIILLIFIFYYYLLNSLGIKF